MKDWSSGILIIGFPLFRQLTDRRKGTRLAREALQDPGPDIVIVDEGTVAKNAEVSILFLLLFSSSLFLFSFLSFSFSVFRFLFLFFTLFLFLVQSQISEALGLINTQRRILLTGKPIQNNLAEYWALVIFSSFFLIIFFFFLFFFLFFFSFFCIYLFFISFR